MESKKYRFFYHYYKQKGKMSVHFKNTCHIVDAIICNVPCETKWKSTQPRLVMQGFATKITFKKDLAVIE